MLYKSIPFEVKEIVPVADGGWEIAGYASTFGGEPDSYGDVVLKGAFAASIAKRLPKFLFEHHTPIGKTLEMYEDDKGLFGRFSVVDTTTGTDAYKLAKAGVMDSLSIGYFTEDYEYREDGVRLLKRVDLPEVSGVAIPANRNALITDVKGYGLSLDEHLSRLRDAGVEMRARLAAGMAKRAGQPVRPERLELLAAASGTLRDLAADMDALATPPPPVDVISIERERLRRSLERFGVLERPQCQS